MQEQDWTVRTAREAGGSSPRSSMVGRKEQVAVRTAICNQILFCGRRSETLRINGFYIGISADGTLEDWAVEILLHTSSPNWVTQENR